MARYFLIALLILPGLIPAEQIAAAGLKLPLQLLFLASCAGLVFLGLLQLRSPTRYALKEKLLSLTALLLTAALFLRDTFSGILDPVSYKFALLFLLLFVAAELARQFDAKRITRLYLAMLGGYLLFSLVLFWIAPPDALYHSPGASAGYRRLDVTGSVTLQGIYGLSFLALSLMLYGRQLLTRLPLLLLACAAVWLMMLSGSRQIILITALFLILLIATQPWAQRRALLLTGIAVAGFFLFSYAIDDTLYTRLLGTDTQYYASGRLQAMQLWLDAMEQEGGALGLGYIRQHVNSETGHLWPHNAFFRFYVEGGLPGLALMVLLFAALALATFRTALYHPDRTIRLVALLFFSIFCVQLMLDNLIHQIYRAAFYYLFLTLAAHRINEQTEDSQTLSLPRHSGSRFARNL